MAQWQEYSDKFSLITPREKMLIALSGLVIIVMLLFSFWIDDNVVANKVFEKKIKQLSGSNRSLQNSVAMLQVALKEDPNKPVQQQIAQYNKQLTKVDADLLALTSALIDPLQMRFALIDLLKTTKGISLVSFQLVGAKPLLMDPLVLDETEQLKNKVSVTKERVTTLNEDDQLLGLYRHGIKIKIKGRYFQLRDYLQQLEGMSWQFFWQKFDYKLIEYPVSELEIEIYSLSTKPEFIGV